MGTGGPHTPPSDRPKRAEIWCKCPVGGVTSSTSDRELNINLKATWYESLYCLISLCLCCM